MTMTRNGNDNPTSSFDPKQASAAFFKLQARIKIQLILNIEYREKVREHWARNQELAIPLVEVSNSDLAYMCLKLDPQYAVLAAEDQLDYIKEIKEWLVSQSQDQGRTQPLKVTHYSQTSLLMQADPESISTFL